MDEISNPYAPSQEPPLDADWHGQEFVFSTLVTEQDICAVSRRVGGFFMLAPVLLIPWAALGLVLAASAIQGRLFQRPVAMILFLLFGAYICWIAWRRLGPGMGRKRLKGYPLIVGKVHGVFSGDYVRWQRNGIQGIAPIELCCYAAVHANMLEFAFDQQRLMVHVLPARAFEGGGFRQVSQRLIEIAKRNAAQLSREFVDKRALDPAAILEMSMEGEAIRFEGPLRTEDVFDSSLRHYFHRSRVRFGWVVLAVDAILVLMLLWFDTFGMAWMMALVFGGMLNWSFWKSYRGYFSWSRDAMKPLAQVRGGVLMDGIIVGTPLGVARYDWRVFSEASATERTISLRLPGTLGHHVVLARHMFGNQEDWVRARAHCRMAGRESPAGKS